MAVRGKRNRSFWGEVPDEFGRCDCMFDRVNPVSKAGSLFSACQEERIADVEMLLAVYNTANLYENNLGLTALHAACINCNLILTQMLMKHGACVTVKDYKRNTPLHMVCNHSLHPYKTFVNGTDIAYLLIKSGADINAKNVYGLTPLHIACRYRLMDIAELLLIYGADVNIQLESVRDETVNWIDTQVDFRGTPLYVLCTPHVLQYVQPVDIVSYLARLLISYGADVNSRNKMGETPLHVACRLVSCVASTYETHIEFIKILLGSGADVNSKNAKGETPLRVAYECLTLELLGRTTYMDLIKVLLENGADLDSTTDYYNLIRSAVHWNNMKLVELFLGRGVEVYPVLDRIVFLTTEVGPAASVEILSMLLQQTLNFKFEILLRIISAQKYRRCGNSPVTITAMLEYIYGYHTPKTHVPSLLELSRDKVRESVSGSCRDAAGFVKAVDTLKIPELVKDIICLRRPINTRIENFGLESGDEPVYGGMDFTFLMRIARDIKIVQNCPIGTLQPKISSSNIYKLQHYTL